MADRRLGPFQVVRELGSGGMGTVHLGRAVEPCGEIPEGATVALKVLHPHLVARPGLRERFRREALAGRRVRHENVVGTFACLDGSDGTLVLVMEAVEGRTLRELLGELGTIPEGLLRELALQIASGLAAIHAAGVVHRDLKPENVLVTGEHRIRIMDLGVARLVDELMTLTREGRFAGSVPYAAPEQFRGESTGPAADLYSLGVLIHELATGSNPFLRDTFVAVMKAHLESTPPPLDEVAPGVSRFLSAVAGTLLRKDPAERFPSAGDLIEVLRDGEASAWWREREAARSASGTAGARLPVPLEHGLVGRGEELSALRAALDEARGGAGRTVLLSGEAGIGKSRLVAEFVRDLADVEVLYGAYSPDGGLGALSAAILERFGAENLEAALAPLLSEQSALVAAFAARVRHESPPAGQEAVAGDALHALTVSLMRALGRRRPTVWIVEDLHFAERDSRRIVLSMARAVTGHPVLLVLTTRPELPEEETATIGRLPGALRLPVGRLSPREVVELLAGAFASRGLAERLGGKVAWKSDGVPWFVWEIVRGLEEGAFLTRQADGTLLETQVVQEVEVPSSVRDLLAARLDGLTDDDRTILDVASVMGFRFDADLVARARWLRRVVVLERLASLQRKTALVHAEGAGYVFDHHQIREVVYDLLPAELRREYHDLLGDAFEDREGEDAAAAGAGALFLAHHRLRGHDPDRALPHLEPALAHLEESYRTEAALGLADLALERAVGLAGRERFRTAGRKAEYADHLGRREDEEAAVAEMERIAEELDEPDLRARAGSARADLLLRTGRYDEAVGVLEEVLRRAGERKDRAREARAMHQLGNLAHGRGRPEEAREWFQRARVAAREIGDRWQERAAIGNLGTVLTGLGRREEARELLTECLRIVTELGDRRGMAVTSCNLGNLLLDLGRAEEARALFLRYREISREIGYRQGVANAAGNLGNLASMRGRLDEALTFHEENLAVAQEIGDTHGKAIAWMNLGWIRLLLEEVEPAGACFEASRDLAGRIGDRRTEGLCRRALGQVAEERGETERAGELFRDSVRILREIGYVRGLASARLALGAWLARGGRSEEAVEEFRAAREAAREYGDPGGELLAGCRLAELVGGPEIGRAEEAVRRVGDGAGLFQRIEARRLLARVTGDDRHAEEERRLRAGVRRPPEA